MAIYMKYDTINGEVTEANHTKWLELGSLQWGIGRGISTPVGSATNREASAPSISEVTVTRLFDSASTALFTEALKGAGKVVKIDLTTTASPPLVYATYTLTNTMISGYSVSTGGDRPSESISLNFTKVEFKFIPYDAKNKAGTPVAVSYDLANATVG